MKLKEFRDYIISNKIRMFYTGGCCSSCNTRSGYYFSEDEGVYFDSSCPCSYGLNFDSCSWEDALEVYNRMGEPTELFSDKYK